MKKIITAIMLLALIALPMFAATQDSNLNVKTTVGSVTEYGFILGNNYGTAPTSTLTGLVGSAEQTLTADGATYSVVVRTNANGGVKVELYSTKLLLKGTGDATIDSIPLYIDSTEYDNTSKKTLFDKSTGKGLRIEQAPFTLTYDTTAAASATVGEYKATVTMVVTGV